MQLFTMTIVDDGAEGEEITVYTDLASGDLENIWQAARRLATQGNSLTRSITQQ